MARNSERVESIADDADRLRDTTAQAREAVRGTNVPDAGADGQEGR